MKALLKAIRSELAASAPVNALATGGIHAGRAASSATPPYLVWGRRDSGSPQYDTGGTAVERIVVGFDAFATGAAVAAETVEAVEGLFSGAPPLLEAGTVMQVSKVGDGLVIEGGATGEAEEVWRGSLQLEFMVQRDGEL